MPKLNDEVILNEISKMQKRWLLQAIKNLKVSEIVHYEYHMNKGLRADDNYEIITITRKNKILKLEEY